MATLVGITLALGVAIFFGRLVGFDRDRAFYATVLVVVASLYGLFAVMGGSMPALRSELVPMTVFLVLSVLGFRRNAWLLVVGLAGHGVFDYFHGGIIANPGVPVWWPDFCGSYDVTAAAFLAGLLWRTKASGGKPPAHPGDGPAVK